MPWGKNNEVGALSTYKLELQEKWHSSFDVTSWLGANPEGMVHNIGY